jgi:PHD/YefM family antitoxin component YafN of YafNO toxin-antitoxin module
MSAKRFCEQFQAVCDEIHETGRPYIITKNGKGLVKLLPPEGWEPHEKNRRPKVSKSEGRSIKLRMLDCRYIS